jgi:DNA repair protein RadC
MPIKDLPLDAQPREKLAQRGAAALSDAELLAVILRTGMAGKTVLQMAQELLELPGTGGLAGLLAAATRICSRQRPGPRQARRADGRAGAGPPCHGTAAARAGSLLPEAVKHYLQLHLAPNTARCLPCCFWTVRTACWLWKKCFAAR